MNRQMKRARASALVVLLGLAGAGCSSEQIAERLAESACKDEGVNCDIDIDGDGGIKIATDEGTMSVDANGNAVVRGADGEIMQMASGDDGQMTITDGSGNIVAQQDGQVLTINDDAGQSVSVTGGGVPEQWPAAIALPPGHVVTFSNVMTSADGDAVMLNITAPGELAGVTAAIVQAIAAAGFTESLKSETADTHVYMFEGSEQVVSLTTSVDAGGLVAASYVVAPAG